MKDSKVYVIIVTYNGMEWMERCLLSIRDSAFPLFTIVIDNGSTDGTQTLIRESFPEVEFIQSEKNLGFGAANNKGVSIAIEKGATHVFLLNQDTHIYPNTIEELLKVFALNEKLGVVSPLHLNDTGDRLDLNFDYYVNPRTCPNFLSDYTLHKVKPYYEIEFVNAAAWLVDVKVIERVGLFSDVFFHYGEDSNFLQRMTYFGYRCAIVPDVYIHHYRLERKGKMTAAHQKRRNDINLLKLLLNIKHSYKHSYQRVLKHAAKQLLSGQVTDFFKLVFLPLIRYNYYVKVRNAYKNPKNIAVSVK